jgi:transposase
LRPSRPCAADARPRRRPDRLYADRDYDHDKYRKQVRAVGITPVIARRGTEHGSGLGVHRWVVEQSFALLHWFRRYASAGRSATTSMKRSSAWLAASAGDG